MRTQLQGAWYEKVFMYLICKRQYWTQRRQQAIDIKNEEQEHGRGEFETRNKEGE